MAQSIKVWRPNEWPAKVTLAQYLHQLVAGRQKCKIIQVIPTVSYSLGDVTQVGTVSWQTDVTEATIIVEEPAEGDSTNVEDMKVAAIDFLRSQGVKTI